MAYSLLYLAFAAASALAAPSDSALDVSVRNAPGFSTSETLLAIRHHLLEARDLGLDTLLDETFPISRRLSKIPILKVGESISTELTKEDDPEFNAGKIEAEGNFEVFCTECYVIGNAVAQFSISNDTFDFPTIVDGVVDQFEDVVDNITDFATEYGKGVWRNLREDISLDAFDLPPLNLSLNLEIPELPECRLRLGFEELEVFIDLRTTLSAGATYSLRLYTSTGQTGFEITDKLRLGVVFNLDLILSASGALDMSHGFHMRFDEGLFMELNLFAKDIANLEHNGALFEFLPVTIHTGEVVLEALLRFSMFSGITLKSPSFLSDFSIAGHSIPSAGGGIEAAVYANIAQLKTNLTTNVSDDLDDCLVQVSEDFEVALGAAAGATVFLRDRTWGPTPTTHTPIFYTSLSKICALPAVTTAADIRARQDEDDLSTTTTATTRTYTGVECLSAGLMDCPASLQSVHKYTVTETLSTAVPSGQDVDWDETAGVQALSPSTFGSGAHSLEATAGRPVSFVPPPPPATSSASPDDEDDEDSEGGSSRNSNKNSNSEGGDSEDEGSSGPNLPLIIGLSVGLGVPALLAVIGGVIFYIRRQKLKTAGGSTVTYQQVHKGTAAVETGKTQPAITEYDSRTS